MLLALKPKYIAVYKEEAVCEKQFPILPEGAEKNLVYHIDHGTTSHSLFTEDQ